MSNKQLLHSVFNELLQHIKPEMLIEKSCSFEDNLFRVNQEYFDLSNVKNLYLFGSGKAVVPMAQAVHQLLGKRVEKSLLIGAYSSDINLPNTTYLQSTHPLPTQKSVEAATSLKRMLAELTEDDFFIYLLSGGNSALVELPEEGITLEEFQKATSLMLKGAMPIEAMNCVRKHLSSVKGGKLGVHTKAKGIVLVLSDVLGNDLHAIGSAPMYFDTTTFEDAINFLEQYELFESMPKSIQNYLEAGKVGKKEETPQENPAHIKHFCLGSNEIVLQQAKEVLVSKNISVSIREKRINADVTAVASEIIEFIKQKRLELSKPHCYVMGGEATVYVKGSGKGGRNQHLALCVLDLLEGNDEVTFLSAATDGVDGNSEAAGALIDTNSLVNTRTSNIDWKHYLENFDSNSFFKQTNELLVSGPTHNNLLDIVMILIEPNIEKGK